MKAPRALKPRDAATLVIVDRTLSEARVLMGRRRPDQVFLPDTFVFPGGRVEAQDRSLARKHPLMPSETARLQIGVQGRPSPTRATALAIAAVRETFEETGYLLGEPDGVPHLHALAYFARAITPPDRPRRYDTRFFVAAAERVAHRVERTDGELLDIGWFTVNEALTLKLPSITRHILEDVRNLVAVPDSTVRSAPIPFYRHRHGRFTRTLLAQTVCPA